LVVWFEGLFFHTLIESHFFIFGKGSLTYFLYSPNGSLAKEIALMHLNYCGSDFQPDKKCFSLNWKATCQLDVL